MKFLSSQLLYFFQNRRTRKNVAALSRFLFSVILIIVFYSICFHHIMLLEGRQFSWITGFYWTLTVMSTLGFGDITFSSDLGYLFTIVVLLSGIVLLLVILPFTLLVAQWQQAVEQSFPGLVVMLGELDDPKTWRNARVEEAALVVATGDDLSNTSVAFTVRGITQDVPMVLTADDENSLDILNFPGNVHVFLYHRILGRRLAERTLGLGSSITVVSRFDEMVIGEIAARQTTLVDCTLGDLFAKERAELPAEQRVQVAGIWQAGRFFVPAPEMAIGGRTILLLAGSMEQMAIFESRYAAPTPAIAEAPVLILGGGRVGRAAAETLRRQAIPFAVVEKRSDPGPVAELAGGQLITGDAADISVLERAGIMAARTVIVTTRNDAMNMYLCFYCRQLRPEIQIISRTTLQRSVPKLHMSGADLVLSYAAIGANSILNLLQEDEITMYTEGLNLFTRKVPERLVNCTLADSGIREQSGCTVVALRDRMETAVGPTARARLLRGMSLVLIGDSGAEQRFLETFGSD